MLPTPRRPDIDALRGLAVTAVVLFHAFPAIAPGGFTGVDAFFVISGFLITSIIGADLDRGAFRFPAFWGRRVRRLFPALALVLVTVLVAGWVLFSADELQRLGREIAAGASFTANLFFATQRGYFHPSGSERPLLHLWSLAIEEQFYLAWPVVLWIVHRLRLPRAPVFAALVAGSFAWNLSLTRARPEAAFYSALARFWELGLGGLLATARAMRDEAPTEVAKPGRAGRTWLPGLVALVGVGLLVAGLRLARPDAPYPGTTALLPTVGTALVLAAGPGALVNRTLLANRAIIGLGLISYPLYLWHWPLLSFASILDGRTPAVATRASVVALSLLLAWVTWRFAEIPAREAAWPSEATRTRGLVAAVATLGLLGWWIGASGGARAVRAEPAGRLVGELGHPAMHRLFSIYPQCPPRLTPPPTRPPAAWSTCLESRSDRPPTVAVLGDSHAGHLFPGLAETLTEDNVLYQGRDDAPFATGPEFGWISRRLASEPSVHAVVLSAFWSSWREPPAGQTFEDAMRRTVETFTSKGKNVILVANTPAFLRSPRPCKYMASGDACHPLAPPARDLRFLRMLRKAVAGNPRATVFDPRPLFSDERGPTMERDGRVLFGDSDHLNAEGSRLVAASIKEEIDLLRRRNPG